MADVASGIMDISSFRVRLREGRYNRLAGRSPVKQILWLRRRILGSRLRE